MIALLISPTPTFEGATMTGTIAATNTKAQTIRGIALVSASAIVWSMGGLFTRLLPFDLWTIIFWRGIFATIFVGLYAYWRFGSSLGAKIRNSGSGGAVVCLSILATIILFPAAFQFTTVAKAFMILSALPFVTAALAWIWLREVPSWLTILASLIAMLGIFIMVGPTSEGANIGDALAAAGTIAQAISIVAIRRTPNVTMLPMVWMAQILSIFMAFPLAQHIGDLSTRDFLVAAGFGLGPMTLGIALYVAGSALIAASLTALIGISEGPIGALWAWIGVGEVPATSTLIGGAVVLAAVIGRVILEKEEAG
jgi:drug/metabolite transporter (DMT)-like permease